MTNDMSHLSIKSWAPVVTHQQFSLAKPAGLRLLFY